MKRICTLTKKFNDGTKTLVEFVQMGVNKNRMVVRRYRYDGDTEVSVYSNIDDERIQRDIEMHRRMGYQ